LIGLVAGVIATYIQALAFRATLRLESSGNIDYNNAIGKMGTVYLRVPKKRTGKGKISMIVQDRLVEVDAITDQDIDLLPKSSVEVIGLLDSTTLIVKSK
jgi:hypothetical protein